ncbi:MAG: DNA-directed RNA polymerase subunit omega [Clostridia bacterium]|nr:DNA-directed RNA polymerase subunit omega [Clostridia bacterium]
MMIEPSIDKLLSKTKGNKYVLCNVVTKRAKEIESVRRLELADQDKKAISLACEEVADGKVKPSKEF